MSTVQPTPKMKTTITHRGTLAHVKIESGQYGTLHTTMDPPITADDIRVINLKRQLAHLPKLREES